MSGSHAAALVFSLVVYPGAVFALAAGLCLAGFRRVLVAKAEGLTGPPLLQPFYDMGKLMAKESLVTDEKASIAGFLLPMASLASSSLALTLMPLPGNTLSVALSELAGVPFRTDLLAVVLLLEIPLVVLVAAGPASGSPYAWLASSRTVRLAIVSTIPYLLAVVAMAIVAGRPSVPDAGLPGEWGAVAGAGAAVVVLLCLPGKLLGGPFSPPPRIAGGMDDVVIEYSGPSLLLFSLASTAQAVALISFLFVLVVPASIPWPWSSLAYGISLVAVSLILLVVERRTAWFKTQQALGFYWWRALPLSAAVLAFVVYLSNGS